MTYYLTCRAWKQTVSKIKSAPFIWTALAIVFELHIVGYITVSCSLDPVDNSLSGSSVHGIITSKNTGMSCLFLLQGSPDLGSKPMCPALALFTIEQPGGALHYIEIIFFYRSIYAHASK